MNLYVGNLPYDVNEQDLMDIFAEYGEVTSVKIVTDRVTGRSKGFGFVEMGSEEAGEKAKQELDGGILEGRPLKVNYGRKREDRRGGGGFGGGGRGGNRYGGGGGGRRYDDNRGGYGGGRRFNDNRNW